MTDICACGHGTADHVPKIRDLFGNVTNRSGCLVCRCTKFQTALIDSGNPIRSFLEKAEDAADRWKFPTV